MRIKVNPEIYPVLVSLAIWAGLIWAACHAVG